MDKTKLTFNESVEADHIGSDSGDLDSQVSLGSHKKTFLDNIAYIILVVVAFFVPLFFLPIFSIPVEFSKSLLLSVGVLASLILWLIARLKDGSFVVPKTSLFVFYVLIPLVFFISALASPAIKTSLFGIGSEVGSFFSVIVMFVLAFLSSVFFQSDKRIFNLYLLIILSMFALALFQAIRLVGGADVLSFGLFTTALSNLVGKWNDMAIFFGFTSILSLLTIEFFGVSRLSKIVFYAALVTSLLFMFVINFAIAWVVVGLFAIVSFIYMLSFGRGDDSVKGRKISILSVVVIVLSLVAIFLGGQIGNFVSSRFGISQIEARPTWSATIDVAKNTLAGDPILGAGPNRFAGEWLLSKPDSVNQSVFWDADFNFGIGIIPSFAVTTGLLGVLSWIVFLGLFAFVGIGASLSTRSDKKSRYLVISSFLGSLYLWIFSIFYVPNVAIFGLAFLMTGVFVASLVYVGVIKNLKISFSNSPKRSFTSVLILVLMIILSVVGVYVSIQKFTSAAFFQASRIAINSGDIERSKASMERAVGFGGSDLYYRSLSDINLAELSILVSANPSSLENLQTEFQDLLGNAIKNARIATEKDPENYQNWLALARVYESVVPLQIQGAYENAKASYSKALEFNPKSPAIYLSLARLDLAVGNQELAKEGLAKAIELKQNYTDAIFLSARLSAEEGKLNEAIAKVESASIISPNDVGLFFNLGFLKYSDSDFEGAVVALERAVSLRPDYANAKYFLGLSYDRVGRTEEAVVQFEGIEITNPDNNEVKQILANLRAGRRPFASIDVVSPEDRDTPPIEDDI